MGRKMETVIAELGVTLLCIGAGLVAIKWMASLLMYVSMLL